MNENDIWMSTVELGEKIGLHPATIMRYVKTGIIPLDGETCRKLGRKTHRFKLGLVLDVLEKRAKGGKNVRRR